MIAAGFLPLLHVLAVAGAALPLARARPGIALLAAAAVLYVVPPLASRLCRLAFPLPGGVVPVGSAGFLAWWLSSQWQAVFNRLPALEELLRLVPGAYSLWLRLWGARVGRLVYWSPGLRILDRPLLEVGDRAVFGTGVRVHGHLMRPDAAGKMSLIVAPVSIGAEALVGAYSLLSPGAAIAPGETSPILRPLGPFTEWRGDRRHAGERRDPS